MSSMYAQLGNGPFVFEYAAKLGHQPFMTTAALLALLDSPVEERPVDFVDLVRKWTKEFESLRSRVKGLVIDDAWKHKRWNRAQKIFYNLKCELCTLDEAVADYLLSLPPALRAHIAAPGLTDADIKAASDAYTNLMERINKAITG